MRETPYPGCPAEETLQDLAAGIVPSESIEAITEHAAHCDFCGPILARYMREFSETLDEEESDLLAQLRSSKPSWQKQFVREYIKPAEEKQGWSFFAGFWPRLATAGIAVVAVAFGLYSFLHQDNLSQAQKLVASAYSERRTTEMRFSNAPYASFNPVPIVKGAGDSGDWKSVPASLVEAEALLKKKDGSGDLSPQWLQVEGRIDVLQGSSKSIEEAVEIFEKALAKAPDNQALKIDLAAAYFEKEMRADHERPVLMKTIDLLNDVIKNSKPEDAPLRAAALFNLAIAYEKSEALNDALSTWQQYLQLDNTSEWATEARKHVETLQKAIPPPKVQGYATPSYFLAHSSDPAVLADLEDYQDIAMRSWLPAAIEDPASDSGKAVAKLSTLLKQRHSDPWLQDFVNQTTPADLAATKMLSAAFNYDWNDLHHQGIRESQNAADIFKRHSNLPGELRARYQEVYGLQRSLAGDDCLQHVDGIWEPVFNTKYRWLQTQLALERASCANMTLDFDTSAVNVNMARNIARQFQFPELSLRVAGFEAGIQQWQENYDGAWKKASEGLQLYWDGKCAKSQANVSIQINSLKCPYSWERIYQFYSVMQQCARKLGFPHTSEALLLRGISILEDNAPDDVSLKAMLYLKLANILSQQGDFTLADSEAEKAESLLKESPSRESTAQIYAAVTRIELAEFELARGNGELALSKIEPLRTFLANQDDFVRLDFYTVQGEIYRQLKRFDEAITAYESGIQVAEGSLDSQQDGIRLNWISATARTYRGLTRTLLKLRRDKDALSVWERFQGRSLKKEASTTAEAATPAPTTDTLYPQIPFVSEPHLIYASFDDGLQIWFVNGSQIHSKWIAVKHEDLQRQVIDFAKQCANPSLSPDRSQVLYSLMLQPVIADLPPSGTVAVELDEPLLGLSFEALRNSAGRYFADDHTVVYSPGVFAEETLRQPKPLSLQDPMLLVDASQAVEGAALPGHSEEVTAVKRAFANTRTLGPSEIKPEEVRAALTQSSEFHFSGHGKPEGTGTALVIGSDRVLGANDLTPGKLKHIQLAVLSACASGSAKKGTFDQGNLVRAFLSGGVPTVIASRWDVDSKSTAHFMESFYGRLRTGAPASQALEYAQAEMRAVQSHPYYWAAFNLTGRVN